MDTLDLVLILTAMVLICLIDAARRVSMNASCCKHCSLDNDDKKNAENLDIWE